MKIILTTILYILSSTSFGQTTKLVEEIAFYHLDSLTHIDTNFRHFKYIFNGYIDKGKIDKYDTLGMSTDENKYFLNSAFKNLTISNDSILKRFSVPDKKRRNGAKDPLTVYRHLKANNLYYVLFQINYESGGQNALIIMDIKGNMIRRRVESFVY